MKKLFILFFLLFSFTLSATIKYVKITGNDGLDGTSIANAWLTWKKAFATAVAGDTIYFMGGVYEINDKANLPVTANSGTAGNPICFFNYPGEVPVLDCNDIVPDNYGNIIRNYGKSYLNYRGLTMGNLSSTEGYYCVYGLFIENGHDIHVENCVVHGIDGTAFTAYHATEIYFKNCDAYDNGNEHADIPGNSGTGFTCGTDASYGADMYDAHIYYEGCRSWDNADNGYSGTGVGQHDYKNCWAFSNGFMGGSGAGFKLGWGTTNQNTTNPLSRYVYNCIAACNGGYGFSPNNNNGNTYNMHVYNNLSYHNGYRHFLVGWTAGYGDGFIILNYIGSTPAPNEMYANNISYANEDDVVDAGDNYTHQYNSWDHSPAVTVTDADFVSLDTLQLRGAREADSSLPVITFGHLVAGSDLIDAGTDVGLTLDGADNVWGNPTPSLGPFERPEVEPTLVESIDIWGTDGATTIEVEAGTLQMLKKTLPVDATDTTVVWLVFEGTGDASISSIGLVTAQVDGTVTIRATAHDGSGIYGEEELTISNQNPDAGLPEVSTQTPAFIHSISALVGGDVVDDGGVAVTDRGVCWSTSENPTTSDSHNHEGTGVGVFTSIITGLKGNTTYHYRAFAINIEGTAYGTDISFTTSIVSYLNNKGKKGTSNGKLLIISK